VVYTVRQEEILRGYRALNLDGEWDEVTRMYRKRSQSGPMLNEPEHLSAKWKMLCHTQRRTVKSDQEVQSVPFYVARQDSRLRGVDVAGRVNVGPRIR
jgi:hypothetical protein